MSEQAPSYTFSVGIDISKKTLDYAVVEGRRVVQQGVVPNNSKGLALLDKALHEKQVPLEKSIICCENTGIYTAPLLKWSTTTKYPLWLETPLVIKRSMGLVRGKDDRKDAARIALYAMRHQDQAKRWQAPKKATEKLKALARMRARILKHKQMFEVPLEEIKQMEGMESYKLALACCEEALIGLKKALETVEAKLQECIQEEKALAKLYKILLSVPGVGPVLAVELMVATDSFSITTNAKKIACYAGVVPFAHESGTSVRGKHRVSSYANKRLKKLLHMASVTLCHREGEMGDYYRRKKEEGKHPMSILNAIRNKIVKRVCACVREDRCYQKDLVLS